MSTIDSLRIRLKREDPVYYNDIRLNTLSYNDMVYALTTLRAADTQALISSSPGGIALSGSVVGESNPRTELTADELGSDGSVALSQWPLNVRDAPFNAVGDGVTDDTGSILAAFAVAFPLGGVAARAIYFPAGTYKVSLPLVAGQSGTRYYGINIFGAGSRLSKIVWYGGNINGILEVRNGYQPRVSGLAIQSVDLTTNFAKFCLWYNVEDGISGIQPHTDSCELYFAEAPIIIGGVGIGTSTAKSGQYNSGYHTNVYIRAGTGSGTELYAAKIGGANGECQYFIGCYWSHSDIDSTLIHTYNGRGIYLIGGEIDFELGGDTTVIHAEGASLPNGGGFRIQDYRIEGGWRLFKAEKVALTGEASDGAIDFVADHVHVASAFDCTDPCDLVHMAYTGRVNLSNCRFPAAGSRVRWVGLSNGRYGVTTIEQCSINNTSAISSPNSLVVLDAAGIGGATGGLNNTIHSCIKTSANGAFDNGGQIPASIWRQNQDHIVAATTIHPIAPIYLDANALSNTGETSVLGLVGARFPAWLMDSALTEQVRGLVQFPDEWVTFNADLIWSNAGAGAGDIRYRTVYSSHTNTEDTTIGDVTVNITLTAPLIDIMKDSRVLSNIAIQLGKVFHFRLIRVGADAADTLTNDAAFIGLRFTRAS